MDCSVRRMINPLKYIVKRKMGLVLGSGGAKGMAHVAVIECLRDMEIPIHMIVGSSIGSVIGALYCCGSLDRFKSDVLKLDKRGLISFFDPVFPRSGFVQGNSMMDLLGRYIPDGTMIEDLPIPLAVCATEYESGMTVVFRSGRLMDALRASISIPGIMVPVRFRGSLLLDGGVANPLPVNIIEKMGAGIIVAVNLHPGVGSRRLRSFVKSEMHRFKLMMDAEEISPIDNETPVQKVKEKEGRRWLETVAHWLRTERIKRPRDEMPSIIDVMSKSFDIMEYVNTMLMLKYHRPTVLIEPEVFNYGTFDFNRSGEILIEGERACRRARGTLLRRVKLWV
ncbi:MAG: patatin-like phospholipase family protein [Spirochaetes bacterium]|nr:patatin-like phospholipase family protein [Spirochaetota bacterium]